MRTLSKYILALLFAVCACLPAVADSTPPAADQPRTMDQVIDRVVANEQRLYNQMRNFSPLVETYIQNLKPDKDLGQVPAGDKYFLGRANFQKGVSLVPLNDTSSKGRRVVGSIGNFFSFAMQFLPDGFLQMIFIDTNGFDKQHYKFDYVRREFLGEVRCLVFDVTPTDKNNHGRFLGRIWVEDQDGNIVRFNGTYTGPTNEDDSRHYFHFDSWRMNVQPGVWLPVEIYVEETDRGDGSKPVGLKAQTHFWGYSLKLPTRESESVSMKIEDAVDKSDDSQDVSPLQATRNWVTQAENNVIDRLEEAGLVAPLSQNGYEQQILDQILVNLAVPNNLAFSSPVHCRVMLTDTVEATTVGNTILISKGLVDTLPNEEAIASVVSLELAHIVLGHHIDTRYAFNDRLLFPDEATFKRIEMNHTDHDNAEAAKRAMEYLSASMYKDKFATAGLYWTQLADRAKELKSLNSPLLGDSLLKADGTPWMADLSHASAKINWDDLSQVPALPLGSWLKTDPWDDKVKMLSAKRYAPMNPRDKMPLEVTPIYFKLQRYELANAAPAQAAPAQAAPAAAQPQAADATQQSAPAEGTTPSPQ